MKKKDHKHELRKLDSSVLETENRAVAFRAVGDNGTLVTRRGMYILKKHRTLNIYIGVAGGYKVHVSIKTQILIFWA